MHARFSIYPSEVGSYALGGALSERRLFSHCRENGDPSGSLKLFVSTSSDLPISSDISFASQGFQVSSASSFPNCRSPHWDDIKPTTDRNSKWWSKAPAKLHLVHSSNSHQIHGHACCLRFFRARSQSTRTTVLSYLNKTTSRCWPQHLLFAPRLTTSLCTTDCVLSSL